MELITNILIEYLKHNKRLVVPKLGTFIVKQSSGDIFFSELIRNDDGVLRSLLMAYGVKELEANGIIDRMVFEVRHAVSMGESYTIKGLGTFSAGENNTITFKVKREPQKIGGNIKPPIETLANEKVRMHRQQQAAGGGSKPQNRDEKIKRENRSKRSKGNTTTGDDMTSIGKQEAYLRGLKYDKNKNRRRSEDSIVESRRKLSSRSRVIIFIILALAICVAIWFTLRYLDATHTARDTENGVIPVIEERIIESDSLAVDSLIVEPIAPTTTEPITTKATQAQAMSAQQHAVSPKQVAVDEQDAQPKETKQVKAVEVVRVNNTENR